jgi:SP family general alpha glucoside:H+ symporter-like MFS transporter
MAGKEIKPPIAADRLAPNEGAQHAADDEKSMGLFQAIRLYPKAVGWSVVLSSALIMEGYDLALLGSLYGSPMFNQKYGVLNEKTGKWAVQPRWQSALYVVRSKMLFRVF